MYINLLNKLATIMFIGLINPGAMLAMENNHKEVVLYEDQTNNELLKLIDKIKAQLESQENGEFRVFEELEPIRVCSPTKNYQRHPCNKIIRSFK